MVRKQIYLGAEQQRKLRRIAARCGCAEAEVIRTALDQLPEYDDPLARRLAEVGLLVQPADDEDRLTDDQAEQLEQEMESWLDSQTEPLGLSEAVREDRDSR